MIFSKKHSIFSFFILFASFLLGQSPTFEWHRCYGGTNYDFGNHALLAPDGEMVVVGSAGYNGGGDVSNCHDTTDYWMVKIRPDNTIRWRRCWGGSGSEAAVRILYTADNKYLIAGNSRTQNNGEVTGNHGLYDFWVMKMDTTQEFKWGKSYGGSLNDQVYDMIQTYDGNYVLCGFAHSNDSMVSGNHGERDLWVIKIDTAGTLLWQKCLGGTKTENASSIVEADNHDLMVVGRTTSTDGDVVGAHGTTLNEEAWILRLSENGNLLWQKCLGGTSNEQAKGICKGINGGFWVCGATTSANGDFVGLPNLGLGDAWVAKIDDNGNILFIKKWGGAAEDVFNQISASSDGNYLLTGTSRSTTGDLSLNYGQKDIWSMKMDENGNMIWKSVNGGSLNDDGNFLLEAWNGYVLVGSTLSYDNGLATQHGGSDMYVAKLGSTVISTETAAPSAFISLYPNPTQDNLTIDLSDLYQAGQIYQFILYNLHGQKVSETPLSKAQTEVKLDLLPQGIYSYQLKKGNTVLATGKQVKW